MKYPVGPGLACLGIAVGIGQWLILPERINYEVRFGFVSGAIVLFVIGLALLGRAAWQSHRGSGGATGTRTFTQMADTFYPPMPWYRKLFRVTEDNSDQRIPLHDAARRLYEAARQGKISMNGAETLSGITGFDIRPGSPDDILDWWAIRIAQSDIVIYGRRPPSNHLEQIRARDRKDFVFKEGATKLQDPMNDNVYFTDLCLERKDFVAEYNFESGYHQK